MENPLGQCKQIINLTRTRLEIHVLCMSISVERERERKKSNTKFASRIRNILYISMSL